MKIIQYLFISFFLLPSICFSQEGKGEQESKYYLPPYTISNMQQYPSETESYPGFLTNRGDFQKLKKLSGNGKGIKVGIIDTGLDYTHSRAGGELPLNTAVKDIKDFTKSRPRFRLRTGWTDNVGHGTHVAGHIGARANGKGIEGIASECDLYIAKALGDKGYGSDFEVAQAILWLVEKKVDIINLSLSSNYSTRIEAAVKVAYEKNILVFAAIGNGGANEDKDVGEHPGNSKYTFGIAAIDYKYKIANFSSRSNMAVYSGFGVKIFSTVLHGRYAEYSGTSMSTPDQSGVAALILGYAKKIGKPITGMLEYHNFVKADIADLGIAGRDMEYGYGFIDIKRVIKLVAPPTNISEEEPPQEDLSIPGDIEEDLTNFEDTQLPDAVVRPIIEDSPVDTPNTFEGFKKAGEFILQGRKYILLEEISFRDELIREERSQ